MLGVICVKGVFEDVKRGLEAESAAADPGLEDKGDDEDEDDDEAVAAATAALELDPCSHDP